VLSDVGRSRIGRAKFALIVVLGTCVAARAEHACEEPGLHFATITRAERMPSEWLRVGSRSIEDADLHASLERERPDQYVTGFEEGAFGYICLHSDSTYVSIRTDGFGVSASFSARAEPCTTCNSAPDAVAALRSGTGLLLGQSRETVATLLKMPLANELSEIRFVERVVEHSKRILRTEILTLRFTNDRLVRFDVMVDREPE
jgi:hypothetical protein